MNNGSHSRSSYSALKSVPKDALGTKNDRYPSGTKKVIKDMHKKKRRQAFKQELIDL